MRNKHYCYTWIHVVAKGKIVEGPVLLVLVEYEVEVVFGEEHPCCDTRHAAEKLGSFFFWHSVIVTRFLKNTCVIKKTYKRLKRALKDI